MLLWVVPAAAQIEVEGVKMGLAGDLEAGYGGDISHPGGSSHGLGLGGNATLNGSFYNPNFLSFTVQPYYTRAQANADGASVFDTGGYTGSVNLFSGSNFPGSISVGQVWTARRFRHPRSNWVDDEGQQQNLRRGMERTDTRNAFGRSFLCPE